MPTTDSTHAIVYQSASRSLEKWRSSMNSLSLGLFAAAIAVNPADSLRRMSDEFDNPATMSNWSRIFAVEGWDADQLQLIDIDASQPGRLVMIPYTSTWFQDYRGELTFKEVTGNFVITSEVHASSTDGSSIPASIYSLAGVMLRTPRDIVDPAMDWAPGGENYVFTSVGFGAANAPCLPGPGWHLERKTTTNSNSILCVTPWVGPSLTVQVARIDYAIIILVRPDDGEWSILDRLTRDDFPNTLQVGLVTYTDYAKVSSYTPYFHNSNVLNDALRPDPSSNTFLPFAPDLIAGFEYARFHAVDLPRELVGLDLVNDATLEQLLLFLGDVANPEPSNIDPADLNADGQVNGADLGLVLAAWGSADAAADLDGDGTVNGSDLGLLLAAWTG